MKQRFWIAPALIGAACFGLTLPAQAQANKSPAVTTPPATTAPAARPATRPGDDDAIEFEKLDKNHDGVLDKAEAMLEPALLANFAKADTNKDGKISKEEFLSFEAARHAKK
jgi:hypothetical protein